MTKAFDGLKNFYEENTMISKLVWRSILNIVTYWGFGGRLLAAETLDPHLSSSLPVSSLWTIFLLYCCRLNCFNELLFATNPWQKNDKTFPTRHVNLHVEYWATLNDSPLLFSIFLHHFETFPLSRCNSSSRLHYKVHHVFQLQWCSYHCLLGRWCSFAHIAALLTHLSRAVTCMLQISS